MKIDELLLQDVSLGTMPKDKNTLDKLEGLTHDNIISTNQFKYRGIYILCDSKDEVVYVGSAFARDIRERLKQYTSSKDTGNSLVNDIKEYCQYETLDEAYSYINTLNVYAFQNTSLEYELIEKLDKTANKAGTKGKKNNAKKSERI